MMIKKPTKQLLAILILFSSFSFFNLNATDSKQVLEIKDFSTLAKQMKQQKKGLLLMFHAEDCSYCEALEENILYPMVKSGEYKKQIFIRKYQVDSGKPVIDFSGKKVDHDVITNRYDGRMTPTVLFLDAKGREGAEKLIGYNSTLYADYIEEQLKLLRKQVLAMP